MRKLAWIAVALVATAACSTVKKVVVKDVSDPRKNEKLIQSGQRFPKGMLQLLQDAGVKSIDILAHMDDSLILNTIEEDITDEALLQRLRPAGRSGDRALYSPQGPFLNTAGYFPPDQFRPRR